MLGHFPHRSILLISLALIFATGFFVPTQAQTQSYLPDTNLPSELSAYVSEKHHVESIGKRLFRANASSCPLLLPEFQAKTHRLKDYPRKLQSAAAQSLKAAKHPTIYELESTATNGLRVGDVLLDGGNEYRSEIHEEILNYRQGGFLRVKRNNETLFIPQSAAKICPYAVKIKHKERINAQAKGVEIILSQGLIDFTQNDHELALIMGHELAHLTQGQAGFDPYLAIEFWKRWAGSGDMSSLRGKKRQRLERYHALKEYLTASY